MTYPAFPCAFALQTVSFEKLREHFKLRITRMTRIRDSAIRAHPCNPWLNFLEWTKPRMDANGREFGSAGAPWLIFIRVHSRPFAVKNLSKIEQISMFALQSVKTLSKHPFLWHCAQ
jgi:hypothetical protein